MELSSSSWLAMTRYRLFVNDKLITGDWGTIHSVPAVHLCRSVQEIYRLRIEYFDNVVRRLSVSRQKMMDERLASSMVRQECYCVPIQQQYRR